MPSLRRVRMPVLSTYMGVVELSLLRWSWCIATARTCDNWTWVKFNFKGKQEKDNCVNSLAKRIVGEIVADLKLADNTGRSET